MSFGSHYSDSNYAHFIAGGRSLALIRQYLEDVRNRDALSTALAREVGAEEIIGKAFKSSQPLQHPALVFDEKNGNTYFYTLDCATAEGAALQARLEDIPPAFTLVHDVFARRLTGAAKTQTNPDNLRLPVGSVLGAHFGDQHETWSASFEKIGEDYVISVPRAIRGVFNSAATPQDEARGLRHADGYEYAWFTPPDSELIPLSRLIALREAQKGDQAQPRRVMQRTPSFTENHR